MGTATANIHLTTNRGAADPALTDAKALLIGGRRYRVKAVSNGAITLSETFAGGQLRQVCSGCVTAQADPELTLSINEQISGIPLGALVGTSTNLNFDNFAMVTAEVTEAATQTMSVGKSANRQGTNFFINGAAVLSGATDDLYTIQGLPRKATATPRSRRAQLAPPTSTLRSARTAARVMRPPACASASRVTATTTATRRTCLRRKHRYADACQCDRWVLTSSPIQ